MKCFLPCFSSSKRTRKHSPLANKGVQTHVTEGVVEAAIEFARQKIVVDEPTAEPSYVFRIKIEEQLSNSIAEVTITKEEQIKSLEGIKEEQNKTEKKDIHEEEEDVVNNKLPQEESSESLFSLSINSGKQSSPAQNPDIEVNSPIQLQNQFCTRKEESYAFGSTNPSDPEKVQHVSPVLNLGEESLSLVEKEEEREKPKPVPEYRYRDCSDEVYEDINFDENDLEVNFEEDDVKGTCVQEECYSDSLFSLSTDSRKRISSAEKVENEVNSLTWVQEECSDSLFSLSMDSRNQISSAEKAENEVNSPMPTQVSSTVLNPILNLTQVTVVEAAELQSPMTNNNNKSLISPVNPNTTGKENINLELHDVDTSITPNHSLKHSNRKERQRFKFNDENEGIGVDTSLSSWLVESETTPISKSSNNNSMGEGTPKGRRGSPVSHEDRPILGALTLEEIRKFSVSPSTKSSSRRCRSKSPDETPIIGTVGSYWSHTGQSMDSDFNTSGKDAKQKRSSRKLKTRLEGAFEASVGQV